MEGDPIGLAWKQEAKEIIAAREAAQVDQIGPMV